MVYRLFYLAGGTLASFGASVVLLQLCRQFPALRLPVYACLVGFYLIAVAAIAFLPQQRQTLTALLGFVALMLFLGVIAAWN